MHTLLKMRERRRWLFAALTLLLASPFLLPLWHTRMEAPQYKDDEALRVSVYAGRVTGDLKEIDTLNQYVGVRLPLEGAEMRVVPWAFGALVALSLLGSLAPSGWHRPLARVLLVLLLLVALCGLVVLQFRLYEMGHERGDEIFEGVSDFTPPVLGHIKVANFDAWMSLGAGGWLLTLATALCALLVFGRRAEGTRLLVAEQGGEAA